MTFFQLRRKIIFFSRYLLFLYLIVVLIQIIFPFKQSTVDQAGTFYLQRQDNYWRDIANQDSEENWQKFESIGNISRHHRYATLKNKMWFSRLSKQKENQLVIDKSMTRWAKKNKRNILMQVILADYYSAHNKSDKSNNIISKLTERVPESELLSKYIDANTETSVATNLQQYFAE